MKPNILIVEDEIIIAMDLSMRLEELGYTIVKSVTTGQDAIDSITELSIDIILMDINLEGAMDGIQAANIIKQKINVPIIFITAFADENTFNNASNTDPYAYVLKPFQTRELDFTIRTAINQHKLKNQLLESENRYRTLFESSRFAIVIIDNDGQVKECNKAANTLLSYLNKTKANYLFELFPADYKVLIEYKWRKFISKKIFRGKFQITLPNNKTLFFEYNIQPDIIPNQHMLLVRNITKLVDTRRNVEYLAQLQQESPHPVMRIALDGSIIYANKSALNICREWTLAHGNQVPKEIITEIKNLNITDSESVLMVNVGRQVYSLRIVFIAKEAYVNIYFTEVTELKQSENLTSIQKDLVELVAQGFSLTIVIDQLVVRLSQFIGNAPVGIFLFEKADGIITTAYNHYLPKPISDSIIEFHNKGNKGLVRQALNNGFGGLAKFVEEKNYPIIEAFLTKTKLQYGITHLVHSEDSLPIACIVTFLKDAQVLNLQENTMLQMAEKVIALCVTRDRALGSLNQQAQVFENMYDAIILTDAGNCITELNPVTEKLFGYGKNELIGKNLLSIKLFEKSNKLEKLIKYAQKSETDANGIVKYIDELPFQSKNGNSGIAEVTIIKIGQANTQFSGTLAVIRDITFKKQIENELSRSEANLTALVENTDDIIFSMDRELRYITLNSSAKKFFKEIINRDINPGDTCSLPNLPEQEAYIKNLYRKSLAGEKIKEEFFLEVGKGHYYALSVNPIYSKDEFISGISVFISDITKRKIFELELSRTNFELDSFVYRASHDLRAPLRSILGLINIISLENDADLKFNYVKLIEKSVNKLDKFIADLTDFSRNSRLEIKAIPIDFHSMLQEVIDNLKFMEGALETNITIETKQDDTLYSDSRRLEIVFQNLVSNAIKYRNPDTDSKLLITINNDDKNCTIVFADNGKGIREEYIDKIFNMFYRASEDSYGSGLGLYITKQVAEKLGGKIEVQSTFGVGTIFTFHIPNFKKKAEAELALLEAAKSE